MKKTIAAIYTGKGLADPLQAVINRTLPDWRLVSIIDDQIIGEVKEAGSPTPEIYQRLISYYKAAEAMGAGSARIIARHLLPNTLSVVIVRVTLSIPSAIF